MKLNKATACFSCPNKACYWPQSTPESLRTPLTTLQWFPWKDFVTIWKHISNPLRLVLNGSPFYYSLSRGWQMYPSGTWSAHHGPKFQLSYECFSVSCPQWKNFFRFRIQVIRLRIEYGHTRNQIHKSNFPALYCKKRSQTILARNHDTASLQNLHAILESATTTNRIICKKLMRTQSSSCICLAWNPLLLPCLYCLPPMVPLE